MHRPVWIRRCRDCGTDDLDVTTGQPALLDWEERRWRCAGCGGEGWEAAGMVMPDDPQSATAGCPFALHRR
jgi:hypothetical protein